MDSVQLVDVALRVWSACTNGQHPAPDDIELLRKNASPDWPPTLPVDKLAYAIVERAAELELSQSRLDRTLALKMPVKSETA
jgi:hypothetical protein